jgi:CRP/FNR family cyclic AMP-dependent transcriptional regulator
MISQSVLEQHAFLQGLQPQHYQALAACASETSTAPGDLMLRQGEPATQVHLLTEGQVLLTVNSPNRGALPIETLQAGEPVGLSWLAAPTQWLFNARAQTPVRAVTFDARCLQGLMDADPTLGYPLMQRFLASTLQRLQASRFQMLDLYANPAAARGADGGI